MNITASRANLYSLTYVSTANSLFSTPDLIALLNTSRRNNEVRAVTGMLLYRNGNFMQVLEGTADAVEQAHAKIGRDPRHTGLITLLHRPISERQFGGWSMGFRDLSDPALSAVHGYSDFLNTELTSAEFTSNPSRAQKLLLMFKEKM